MNLHQDLLVSDSFVAIKFNVRVFQALEGGIFSTYIVWYCYEEAS